MSYSRKDARDFAEHIYRFMRYSRKDARDFAEHIYRFMRDKGYNFFIDVDSIRIGDPWASSIENNISECDIFIVILTPFSLTSSYVENEVLQAQRENKIIVLVYMNM